MSRAFAARFGRILAATALWALLLGGADAARTLASGGTWAAAGGVLAFAGLLVLVPGIAFALGAALLLEGDGDPARLVGWTGRALWPADRSRRVRAGSTLAFGVFAAGAFVGLAFPIARHVIESMRMPVFSAMASTLVALALALALAALVLLARRRVAGLVRAREPGPVAAALVSPPAALGLLAVATAAGLWIARDRVADIVEAVDWVPWGMAAATAATALGVAISGLLSPGRRAVVPLLAGGVPVVLGGTFALLLAQAGPMDDVRRACSDEAAVAPLAYRAFKAVADRDGDGLLPHFGEGDCDPSDGARHAGATEIPDNWIDEDCDGADLKIGYLPAGGDGRWDHPRPDAVRDTRWNVVLVTVDALAPARSSLYGYERPTTPFLEALAARSAWFPWAYAQGPSTRLAFPALFASRYDSQVLRETATRIPLELLAGNRMMAEILQAAGMRTVAVLPTSYFANWRGLTQGFDEVVEDPIAHYQRPQFHNAEAVTDAALAAAAEQPERPLFLWLHYYDPHSPQTRPPGDDIPDWGDARGDVYDAELVYTDREIRRFVEGLDRVRPRERTVLIVTGDHGEAFDENHAKQRHGFDLHSTVLHVPLLVAAPFVAPGPIDMPVSSLDLLPTLVNLLGIPGEFAFEGTSLLPQVLGSPPDRGRAVFSQFYLPENVAHRKPTLRQAGVRTADLYFFRDFGNNRERLFRYRADPFETRDLSAEMPEALKALKDGLTRWQSRVAPARPAPQPSARPPAPVMPPPRPAMPALPPPPAPEPVPTDG